MRPQLEFCVSTWNLNVKKDIGILERLQKRTTKKAPGLRGYEYEERLRIFGLTTFGRKKGERRLNSIV